MKSFPFKNLKINFLFLKQSNQQRFNIIFTLIAKIILNLCWLDCFYFTI